MSKALAAEILESSKTLLEDAQEKRHEQNRYDKQDRDLSLVEELAAEAISKADEAHCLYSALGDKVGALKAQHQATLARIMRGDAEEALNSVQSELEKVHRARDRLGMAYMLVAEADALFAFGNYRGALDSAKQGATLARQQADKWLESYVLYAVCFQALLGLGESEEAYKAAVDALGLCKQIAEKRSKARACMAVAHALHLAAPSNAEVAAREALLAFKALGDSRGEAAAQSLLARVLVSRQAFQEVVRPARESLNLCLKSGNNFLLAATFEALVRAHIGCDEHATALQVARQGMTEFEKRSDLPGQAWMSCLLAMAYEAQGEEREAEEAVRDGLGICAQTKDRQAMAQVQLQASEISLKKGELDETLFHGQAALMTFRVTQDLDRLKRTNAVLSEVYSRRGEPELAPNRPEAVKLARQMASAIGSRDVTDFCTIAERFASLGVSAPPLTAKEHNEIFGSLLQSDTSAVDFIKANVRSEISGPVLASMSIGETFRAGEKTAFYKIFRDSGIGYGPRFRCVDSAFGRRSAPKGTEHEAMAYSVLQLQEDADDWEEQLRAHPSILDTALQSGSVIGMAAAP
eukprot:TRINITY_DN29381_c0_g1_i1.p1 TRINITY_DN29381_c0_g1~~TRINITY_DN29381_c0_g1_i1.p1  ORF type:complete len:580 (-),score=140.47 TRINITY_DN29381_c0_g1_i1:83-1822(-)